MLPENRRPDITEKGRRYRPIKPTAGREEVDVDPKSKSKPRPPKPIATGAKTKAPQS